MSTNLSLASLIAVLSAVSLTTGRSLQSPTFTIEARILSEDNAATKYSLSDKFFKNGETGKVYNWIRPGQIGFVDEFGEELCLSLLHDGTNNYIGVDSSSATKSKCETTSERWETFAVNKSDSSLEEPVILLNDVTSGQCAYLATNSEGKTQNEKYYLGLGDCEASYLANLILAIDNDLSTTLSATPSPTPSPKLKTSVHQVCDCNDGVYYDNSCYDTLENAFDDSTDGSIIHVGGAVVEVSETIEFDTSVTLQGHACDSANKRAKIVAVSSFETKTGAMFVATNPSKQEVVLKDLEITSESEGQYVAAFHSLSKTDLGGEGKRQKVQLLCTNIHIHDMQSEESGVGIFLIGTYELVVDDECLFENLLTTTTDRDRWAGGPAIAVISLPESGTLDIAGQFTNNRAYFPSPGTEHAGGGALYLDWMAGRVNITARFNGNQANQGGAVQIQAILGTFTDNGVYTKNIAAEEGNGSRFGALGCIKLYSGATFVLKGSYIDNISEGRGGVVGTNIHMEGSLFMLQGTFKNNRAMNDGGIWGRWSSTTLKGKVVIDIGATIVGNIAEGDNNNSGVFNAVTSDEGSVSMSSSEWERRTTSMILNP
ncbi:hypothetical protein SARC_03747 [Sphaeroforma arctica JP610]|uniref:Uncharacterized protein n=1 Tax=Sphaeroforma arctica JP610 TaxID=667725 RepID=A0A0L0G4N4_9EUKA|nr:hypothetical protein SARC_03747 [Sphaeroforma arctica JP610]KNC84037.1 hypothetical protein SARC_03747 [Sphaeroforma arctica JP610]|eukprot:XP_014157939.1 hypothetical protein SARC_03747 [Sphaeroforma arctica JP610]